MSTQDVIRSLSESGIRTEKSISVDHELRVLNTKQLIDKLLEYTQNSSNIKLKKVVRHRRGTIATLLPA